MPDDPPPSGGTPLPPFRVVLAFWSLVAVVAAAHAAPHHESVARGALYELVNHWAWAALTPAVFLLAHRLPLDRPPRGNAVALHLLAGVLAGVAWGTFSEVAHQALAHPGEPADPPAAVLGDTLAFGFSPGLLIYSAILAAAHALRYYRQSRARTSEALGLRTELAEARLHALRTQLQPHFLFNTLNTVSGLVESDPTATRRVLARLSRLLRHTLEETDGFEVPLPREIALLEDYLDIIRARFGDRIHLEVRVDPDVLSAFVPPLCLQPLVENAVEHGAARRPAGGRVSVALRREDDQVEMEVVDDGPGWPDGTPPEGPEGNDGIGIRNVRGRLKHLYGSGARLEVQALDGGGVVSRIVLPWHPRPVRPGATS